MVNSRGYRWRLIGDTLNRYYIDVYNKYTCIKETNKRKILQNKYVQGLPPTVIEAPINEK